MSGSIKLFQFNQWVYQSIGIDALQTSRNRCLAKSKIFTIFLCLAQFFIVSILFLEFDANSMFDYGITFYLVMNILFGTGIYVFPIFHMENTLKFNECCEIFIENSKFPRSNLLKYSYMEFNFFFIEGLCSTVAYKDIIGRIERLCELLYYAITATVTFYMLSALLYSYFNYFIMHLDADSFYLFFPTWFVS